MENLELKNTITKIKSSMYGLIYRMDRAEERMNKLEDRAIEIAQSEQRENILEKRRRILAICEGCFQSKGLVFGVLEREDKEDGAEKFADKSYVKTSQICPMTQIYRSK